MAKKNNAKTIQEKIEDLKTQILGNAKDEKLAKKNLQKILKLQQQADIVPTEVFIPCSDIEGVYDLGCVKLSKGNGLYIFEAKGGYKVIVNMNMQSTYQMCEYLYSLRDAKDEDSQSAANILFTVLQSPLVASLNQESALKIATVTLRCLNEISESVTSDDGAELMKENIKDNVSRDNLMQAISYLKGDA